MLIRIVLPVLVIVLTLSCSKKEKTIESTPTPASNTVTEITVSTIGGVTSVQLAYRRRTVKNFNESSTGTTNIEFRPKAGRTSILGEYMGTSSNLASFRPQDGDTVRLVESGVSSYYITDKWDGINALVAFTSTPAESQSAAKTRFDSYASTTLPTKKFKQQ